MTMNVVLFTKQLKKQLQGKEFLQPFHSFVAFSTYSLSETEEHFSRGLFSKPLSLQKQNHLSYSKKESIQAIRNDPSQLKLTAALC
jgi:hypothetical protein